jgi:Uma2 family endonuclease
VAVMAATHRFTVEDYHRMGEAGILTEDDRVELIEGEIVDMSPIGRKHQACVDRLTGRFSRGLGERVIVRVQGSIRLSEGSEPQPDLVLLRPRWDFYGARDAGPEDTLLIVEVADTTLAYDRDVKLPLYARAGIPEAWLVDLTGERVIVCREPAAEGYQQVVEVRGETELRPQAFPDLALTASDILGGIA